MYSCCNENKDIFLIKVIQVTKISDKKRNYRNLGALTFNVNFRLRYKIVTKKIQAHFLNFPKSENV